MPRFIVAYDGSDPSRAAFRTALALASRTKAAPGGAAAPPGGWSILLLHVIEPSPDALLADSPAVALDPMMPPHMPMGLPATLVEAERRQRAWVESETANLRSECESQGIAFDARVDVGSLLDVLEDTPGADDILAVGATGRFRRGGVGSTTKALVRNAACPVLVAHAGASGSAPANITSLACPFDSTPCASEAITAARRLAGATGLPLAVLAVPRSGSTNPQDTATLIGALTAAAKSAAGDAATIVALTPAPGSSSASESGMVAAHIQSHPGTLLVMGAYADSWIRELFLGSTTAQVLTALTAPVLLVHDRRGAANPVTAD